MLKTKKFWDNFVDAFLNKDHFLIAIFAIAIANLLMFPVVSMKGFVIDIALVHTLYAVITAFRNKEK